MAASLILTPNGGTPFEIGLRVAVNGVWVGRGSESLRLPLPANDDTYASSPDTEGGIRVRSRPDNAEGGIKGFIEGSSDANFWANVRGLEKVVGQMHAHGGSIAFTPPATGETVTYLVTAMSITGLPQDGVLTAQRHGEFEIVFTCRPYGLLASYVANITALIGTQTNATTVASSLPLLALLAPDPGGSVDALAKLIPTEAAGQNRDHVEWGLDVNYDAADPAPILLDAGPVVTLLTSAAADDILDATAHGFVAGDKVRFVTLTGGAGLTVGTVYHVIAANLAANTFQVSATAGGSAVNFTTDITAATMVKLGNLGPLGGSVNTSLTGEYGSSSIRATLTTTPLAICDSGRQEHVGTLRHRPRLWGAGTGPIWVRLAYKTGSSPNFKETDWVELPFLANWCDLDIGLMLIREAVQGTQTCEWRVEAYSETPGDTLDVDYDLLLPQPGGKARTPIEIETPTTFSARTGFVTESGAITGDTLDDGVNVWGGAGDTDDFVETGDIATRTAVTDTNPGRIALAGTTAYAVIAARVKLKFSSFPAGGQGLYGVVARYVDTSNFLRLTLGVQSGFDSHLYLSKIAAGSTTTLLDRVVGLSADTYYELLLYVDAAGRWGAQLDDGELFVGSHVDLATGGTLAGGKIGMGDNHNSATASTRTYDDFSAWVPTFDHVMYANKRLEVHSDQVIREHSSGEWGRIDSTGAYLKLPPGQTSRIAVKARRNDTGELADDQIADALSAQLEITPRVALL